MASGPGGAAIFGLRVADVALVLTYGGLLLIAGLLLVSAVRVLLRDIRSGGKPTKTVGNRRGTKTVGSKHGKLKAADKTNAQTAATAWMAVRKSSAMLGRMIAQMWAARSSLTWQQLKKRRYGQTIDGLSINGRNIQAGVFNENEVRTAAGITLVLGAFGFVNAFYGQNYVPLKFVTAFMMIEFFLRVTMGLHRSPVGLLACRLTRSVPAIWVSARPKRFAWVLGLTMSATLSALQAFDVRGAIPLTICLVCLSLMWLEAVLGICLGCEIYSWLVRNKWVSRNDQYEVCSHSVCEVEFPKATGSEQ
jgi:hypothetical protein